jgi:DNA-binding CsgD family transcriptional regulator
MQRHTDPEPAGRGSAPERARAPLPPIDPLSSFIERFAGLHRLSRHQTAVVGFAASGLCRKESARILACSLKTVDEHWRRVYLKTGCGSEPQVMAKLLAFALTRRL